MSDRKFYKEHKQIIHTVTIAVVAVVVLWLAWVVFVPTPEAYTTQRLHVSSGQSLTSISNTLKGQGLIRSAIVFRYYVAGIGREYNLQAGDYAVPAGATLNDIAWQIAGGKGSSNDISVFIPEGSNIWEIDKRLADAKLIKEGDFVLAYGSKEGYLFPDTYRFKPDSSLWEIEQKMELNGQEKTKDLIGELSLPVQERIMTIASIIEKEARAESDMQLVSGVIANRIRRQMPLAIDATVSYGACLRIFAMRNPKSPTQDCDVTQIGVGKEIKIDSPFNTYTRAGLPPHPISNPGLNSIESALNPKGDYLYYLSTRDGSQIIFSKTSAEHVANRRKYLGL